MDAKRLAFEPASTVVMHVDGGLCAEPEELLASALFRDVVARYAEQLRRESPTLLAGLGAEAEEGAAERLTLLLGELASRPIGSIEDALLGRLSADEPADREILWRFVEGLYDFWRGFDRFLVCHTDETFDGPDASRPHRRFNAAAEQLQALVRGVYRDIEENITGEHPRVYRQVAAAWNVGILATPAPWEPPPRYRDLLGGVHFIRQLLVSPPLILDPPTNTRTGQFLKVDDDPLANVRIDAAEWLCYPAQVGPLVVFVYVHQSFVSLGCSLANLFELADEAAIARGPDAVYLFGAPPEALRRYGDIPTVFHEEQDGGLLVAAVPLEPRFGYFGYLKKMVLTLHNVVMMRRGRMPFHGALSRIELKDGRSSTVLLIGETAAGKSESLEALRQLGRDRVAGLTIIADDMGSLEIGEDGAVYGYGTETGAFIRLDDLQQGYAWGQVDRAIIMSPQKVNARVVLPVTTLAEVLRGHRIDIVLYANNYEEIDDRHPVVERFGAVDDALAVFREGTAMSKGTTSSSGLTHSYFANIFGPAQYEELHEGLARRTFEAAFASGALVGQLRTRLGIAGYETDGPAEAASALVELIDREAAGA